MKRILIALVLGSLLALNVASVAAAKVSIIGLPNADVYPDTGSTRTVIDQGSRLSARLRAIDAVFYPDLFEIVICVADAERMDEIADIDGYYLSSF